MSQYVKKRIPIYASFALLICALGVQDSLRGVFSPYFAAHFALSAQQLAAIISVSYIGNLLFLLFGGYLMDRFATKRVFLCVLLAWVFAIGGFILTDSYGFLLLGMALALGASTLLSTTLNILTPLLSFSSPVVMVNLLFFIQGAGTCGAQLFLSGQTQRGVWQTVNLALLTVGVLAFILLFALLPSQPQKKHEKQNFGSLLKNRAFVPLVILFCLYFIFEHGVMNWLVIYAKESLNSNQGGLYTSIFFAGIMAGRLLLSPFLHRIGIVRSLKLFSLFAAILYLAGVLLGAKGLPIWAASGVFYSVVYPTLVLRIVQIFPKGTASGASGLILSVAYIGDVLFNFAFGALIEAIGYHMAVYVLPICAVLFVVLLFLWQNRLSTIEQST